MSYVTRRALLITAGAALGAAVGVACAPSASQPAATQPPVKPAAGPSPAPASPAAAKAAGASSPSPQTAPGGPGAPATIKFPTGPGSALGLMVEVMVKRGVAARNNLTLELSPLDPAAAEKATLVRQVDAGTFPIISAGRVNAEGQQLTIFGPLLWIHYSGLTYIDRPYTKLADLKGKKVATLDPVSSGYQSTQVLAAMEGLDFAKDFQVVTSPAPAVIAILERGDVEAIFQFEPNIGNLLTTGKYKTFLDYNEEWKRLTGQNMFSIGLAAHDDWIQKNKDTAKRLVTSVLETSQLIQREPAVFEENAAYLGLNTPEKIKMAEQRMPKLFPTEWNQAIADNAASIVAKAVDLKILDKAPTRQYISVL